MRSFRDVSIRTKLTLLMVVVVSLVVVLLCITFMINDVRTFKASMADEHSALADVLGANSAAALDFQDPLTGENVLSSLRLEPTVVFACTYDAEGTVFASYQAEGGGRQAPPLPDTIGVQYFEDGHFHVFREIVQEENSVGAIYLCSSMDELDRHLRHNAFILTVVLVASVLMVLLLASRLQRVISRPILRLVEAAETVSTMADYSIRVEKHGHDELGTLCDGFNEMLTQIQKRDAEVERYRDHLEELVRERTADLEVRSQELARAISDLERSNKDLDDFAYIASHDLKEPLRGISNYATFLNEDYADKIDDEGQDKLRTLTRLCQRLETLIDSLLRYSRLGRAELAIQETDLGEVVSGVLDTMHVTLEEQNVEVRIPERLPSVQCDEVRVGEMIRNLITNAVKYNDKPEKWIEIGFHYEDETDGPADANGPTPVFHVRDNGIGIRDKHFEAIFRIFKRLHAREKYGGGSGAGLTFVKQIIERHGGRIWVESTCGEGSTFYFTLQ